MTAGAWRSGCCAKTIASSSRLPEKKWLAADHLELWLGEKRFSYLDHCLPVRARRGLTQFAILPGARATRVLRAWGGRLAGRVTAKSR